MVSIRATEGGKKMDRCQRRLFVRQLDFASSGVGRLVEYSIRPKLAGGYDCGTR